MYRGPSVAGNKWDPRTLPHWPIAIYNGIPVAFFVSEPRLYATTITICERCVRGWKLKKKLTPCDDNPNNCVCPSDNAKCREIPYVVVIRDDEEKEISKSA